MKLPLARPPLVRRRLDCSARKTKSSANRASRLSARPSVPKIDFQSSSRLFMATHRRVAASKLEPQYWVARIQRGRLLEIQQALLGVTRRQVGQAGQETHLGILDSAAAKGRSASSAASGRACRSCSTSANSLIAAGSPGFVPSTASSCCSACPRFPSAVAPLRAASALAGCPAARRPLAVGTRLQRRAALACNPIALGHRP